MRPTIITICDVTRKRECSAVKVQKNIAVTDSAQRRLQITIFSSYNRLTRVPDLKFVEADVPRLIVIRYAEPSGQLKYAPEFMHDASIHPQQKGEKKKSVDFRYVLKKKVQGGVL